MSSREEFPLNSLVKYGVKMEPQETDLSTEDLRENNSSLSVNNRIPSPSDHPNQLDESKVFVNKRKKKKRKPKVKEEKPKLENTLPKIKRPNKKTCFICGIVFIKKKLLLDHQVYVHNILPKFPKKCYECGKPVKKYKKLRKHMRRFHPTKLFTCEVCSDGFLTNKALNTHYKRHQGISTRSWYVSTFENSASGSVESKDSIKTEACTDITMETVKSKDNLWLITNKALKTHYEHHQGKSTRSWYVSTFENSASRSVESKDSIKTEECTDISMETVESKDNLCLPIIKAEPT